MTKRVAKMRGPKAAKAPAPLPVPVGSVTVARSVDVPMSFATPTTGVRIKLDHLGLGRGADTVVESSGNSRYLDAMRPPVIDKGDLLVFFDPEVTPGNYGFSFTLTWTEEMEQVTPKPLKDGKYDGIE